MEKITSADGTPIAYDRLGDGSPVILVCGGSVDRMSNASLAALLAENHTVYNYDRRGRGDSGDAEVYAIEREFEDLDAIFTLAGGSAHLYGTSSGAALALLATASGRPVNRLALWEPPYIIEGSRPPVPADWGRRIDELVGAGRPGDALQYWMTEIIGVPAEFIEPLRNEPFWLAMEPNAHMLSRDADMLRDFSLPAGRYAAISVPVLLLDGRSIPWLSQGLQALVGVLPNAELRTMPGQQHDIAPDDLAEAVGDFLAEPG
jgi:alpha-beta hydrolase superfamily lysophospholipase